MPRHVLHQRQICPALKRQRNKAGPHPVRRHCDPDSLSALLDNAFNLVGMQRFFLGMIAFAKTEGIS